MTSTDSTVDIETFQQDWQAWHTQHEAHLADQHGFLAITSLNWLTEAPQRFPDAPGEWSTDGDSVQVNLSDDEQLVIDGQNLTGQQNLGPIAERGGINAVWGDAVIEIAKRGGYYVVRPRHPENPLLTSFQGTPTFTPDPRWVATGRYRAFDQPRPTTVGAVAEGLQHVYDAPGEFEFSLAGQDFTLTAFPGHVPGTFNVLFTDATSGVSTYAANRSLSVAAPDPDGQVVLDFNRATNLPCAYTDLATCPLPPAENRLSIAIEAGEQIPYEREASHV